MLHTVIQGSKLLVASVYSPGGFKVTTLLASSGNWRCTPSPGLGGDIDHFPIHFQWPQFRNTVIPKYMRLGNV